MSILVLQSSRLEREAGCFALFVFLVPRACCVALYHDAMGCLQFVLVIFPGHSHLLFLHQRAHTTYSG